MKKPEYQDFGLSEARVKEIQNAVSILEAKRKQAVDKIWPIVAVLILVGVFIPFFVHFIFPDVLMIKRLNDLFDLIGPIFLCLIVSIAITAAILYPLSNIYNGHFEKRIGKISGYNELKDFENKLRNYEWEEKRLEEERKRLLDLRKREFWLKQDGYTFEKSVAEVFERLGHKVRLTKGSGDEGVDIFLDGNIVVQCKATQFQIAPAVVRDLFGAMHHFDATKGIIVSTGGFSSGCYQFARDKKIELWDLNKLLDVAGKLGIEYRG